MRSFPLVSPLILSVIVLLSGCATGILSGVAGQDDPDCIVEVDPLYTLPLPDDPRGFFLIQGICGAFSHDGRERFAFDWSMPEGTPVLAAREGKVVYVDLSNSIDTGPLRSRRANLIRILHPDGTIGVYAHLSPSERPVVSVGEEVGRGDLLGYSGNTGFSTRPHLHFHVETPEGEAVPVSFMDVEDPYGVPRVGRRY